MAETMHQVAPAVGRPWRRRAPPGGRGGRGVAVALVAALWVCLAGTAPAWAMTEAQLLGPGLEPEPVQVRGLYDGTLHYFDGQRRLQRRGVDAFVSLRQIAGRSSERAWQRLQGGGGMLLSDGQRLAGRWVGASEDGQALLWEHAQLGRFEVPLDRIAQLWHGEAGWAELDAPPSEDVVVLSNGDRLRGFIESVDASGVSMQLARGGEPVHLPATRMARVVLANPRATPAAGWHEVHLADGSRVLAGDMEMGEDGSLAARFALVGGASVRQVAGHELVRVDFTGAGRRLVAVRELPRELVDGGEVFGLPVRPHVVGGALHLRAPVTVRFELPDGAERFAGVAELATGPEAPRDLLDWADFDLLVRSGEAEHRWHLYGQQPRVRVNVALDARSLEIELEPGVNGPIMDRLRLVQAYVLVVDQQTPASPGARR